MIGQIFIYILSLVLITFVLIFGYNAITSFRQGSEKVLSVRFQSDLSNMVEIISPDYGSVKIKSFELPSGFNQVCFIKNYNSTTDNVNAFPTWTINPLQSDLPAAAYTIIKGSADSKIKKNTFLIKDNTVGEDIFIGNIDVDANGEILCLTAVSRNIKIKFEGKGDHALLSEG